MPECLVDQKLLLFYLRCKVHLKCSCFWYLLLPQRFVGKHWSILNLLFCRDVSNLYFHTTSYYFYCCWPLLDLYSSEFLDKWINFWLISFLLFKSFLKRNSDSNSASTSFTSDFKLFGSLCFIKSLLKMFIPTEAVLKKAKRSIIGGRASLHVSSFYIKLSTEHTTA